MSEKDKTEEGKKEEGKKESKFVSRLGRGALCGFAFGFGFLLTVDLGTGPNKEWETMVKNGSFVDDELYDAKDVKDKKIALFATTDSGSRKLGKGLGKSVWIGEDGRVDVRKMGAMDFGTVASGEGRVLFVDEKKAYIFGKDAKTARIDFGMSGQVGAFSGYLADEGRFAAVFNSMYATPENTKMAMLVETEKGFRTYNFKYEVASAGFDGSSIYMVTTSGKEDGSYTYREFKVSEGRVKETLEVDLGKMKSTGLLAVSPIVRVAGVSYVMVDESSGSGSTRLVMYGLTKEGKTAYEMKTYGKDDSGVGYFPYTLTKSLHESSGSLYFADGYGVLRRFDMKTKEWFEVTKLKGARKEGVRFGEGLAYSGKELVNLRYDEGKRVYTLDTYVLKTGELSKQVRVKGLEDQLRSFGGNRLGVSDIEILDK